MSIHDKLAARLRSTPACLRDGNSASSTTTYSLWQDLADVLADAIESGDFDDILGVRKPSIEDVRREAARVFGEASHAERDDNARVCVVEQDEECGEYLMPKITVPTIAAAYQALRALPDWKGEG